MVDNIEPGEPVNLTPDVVYQLFHNPEYINKSLITPFSDVFVPYMRLEVEKKKLELEQHGNSYLLDDPDGESSKFIAEYNIACTSPKAAVMILKNWLVRWQLMYRNTAEQLGAPTKLDEDFFALISGKRNMNSVSNLDQRIIQVQMQAMYYIQLYQNWIYLISDN